MEKEPRAAYCVTLLLLINGLVYGVQNTPISSPISIPTLHQLIKNQIMDREQMQDLTLQCLEHNPDVASMLASQFHDESRAIIQSMYPIALSDVACLRRMHIHSTTSLSAILATNEFIVIGDDNGVISVWDAVRGQRKAQLDGHTNRICCLLIDKYHRLISASHDHTMRIWDTDNLSCAGVLTGHTDWIDCAAISPDNELISGSHDQTARVWDLKTLTMKATLVGHTNWVTGVTFDVDSDIISVSDDGSIRTWDKMTYANKKVIELPNGGCIRSVLYMPDGDLQIGLITGELHILDGETGVTRRTLSISTDQITQLQLLAGGDVLATSDRLWVRILDKETLACKGIIAATVCVIDDSERVVTAHDNGHVCCWDISMLSMHNDMQLLKAALLCNKQERENAQHYSVGLTDQQKLTILRQCIIKK